MTHDPHPTRTGRHADPRGDVVRDDLRVDLDANRARAAMRPDVRALMQSADMIASEHAAGMRRVEAFRARRQAQ